MHIVIDSIIRRMISDFFRKMFLTFSNFVCILRSSLFNQIISRIFFICNLFIIFLMIMIFRIFRSISLTIKIVNSQTCFVVLKLINLFAIIDLITDSKAICKSSCNFLIWIEDRFFAVVQSSSACFKVCCAASNCWRWASSLLLFKFHRTTRSYYAATRAFSNFRRYSLNEDTFLSLFSILSSRFDFLDKSWWWW
jgi:hypothetical protein